MSKPTLLLLFAGLILWGCEKSKPQHTTVQGQVRTYGTEEAIRHPPVKVQIVERLPVTTWGSGPTYEPKTEVWSDENARFSLSYELDPEKEYFIAVDESTVRRGRHYLAPTYSSIARDSRKIKSVGGSLNLNYYLSAYGWVEFHFLSENPQPGDRYAYSLGGGAYEEFFGSVDAYRIWDFAANWEHDIVYTLVRNGEYYPNREYFTPTPFDTIFYEVKFQ